MGDSESYVIDVDINARKTESGADSVNRALNSIVNNAERATRQSGLTQTEILEKTLRRNTELVSSFASMVGGHYGRLGAMALRFAMTYDDVGNRAREAAAKAAEAAEKRAAKEVEASLKATNAAKSAREMILKVGDAHIKVEGDVKRLTTVYQSFENALGRAAGGRAPLVAQTLERDLGIDVEKAVREPEKAYAAFLLRIRKMNAEARTSVVSDVLGGGGAKYTGDIERATLSVEKQTEALTASAVAAGTAATATAAVEGAAEGAAVAEGAAAVATAGFTASLAALLIPLLAVVATLAILAVGVGVATKVISDSALAAGNYGEQIYKVELATGASAKTLSVLSVISKETGVSMDALARTTARLETNISKGISQPTGEAGRALRTLKVNFDDLKKATPEQQLGIVAKALDDVTAQGTRARASSALLGRGYQQQSEALAALAEHYTETQARVRRLGLELDENGAVRAHGFTVALNDTKLAGEALYISLGQKVLPQITGLLLDVTDILTGQRGAWSSWGDFASTVIRGLRVELLSLADAFNAFLHTGDAPTALGVFFGSQDKNANAVVKGDLMRALDEQLETARQLVRSRTAAGDEYAAGKTKQGEKSELEKLADQYKHLTFEINALEQVGSRENVLKFKVEDLQRVKTDLESILKLRHELNLPLDAKLPAANDAEGIREVNDALKDFKKYRDAVKEAGDAQSKADLEYATVLATHLLPVVDAGTRAAVSYLKAIHDRRDAEAQLTADVITLSRQRRDALADETGSTLSAYRGLQKELIEQANATHDSAAREQLLQQIARGGRAFELSVENKLVGRVEINEPKVPREISNIEGYVREIAERGRAKNGGDGGARADFRTLSAFAEAHGFTVTSTTGGRHNVGSLHPLGQAVDVRTRDHTPAEVAAFMQEAREAGLTVLDERTRPRGQRVYGGAHLHLQGAVGAAASVSLGGATSSPVGSFLAKARSVLSTVFSSPIAQALAQAYADDKPEQVNTNIVGASPTDLLAQAARDTASADINKPRNERDFRIQVEGERRLLEQAETSVERRKQFELDVLDASQQYNRQRREDARKTNVELEVLSQELARAEANDIEFVARVENKARLDALNARIALKERSVALDYEIAHAADNASLEYEVAWKEAIEGIARADIEAHKRRLAADVQLADQGVYHAERANAKVAEFLAQQRSLSDVIADFRIGVIEATYKTIDDGLDRITRKLGVVGSLIKDLLSGLIRIALNSVFQKLFAGGSTLGGIGGGSQSGGGIGSTVLNTILGRVGTPPFSNSTSGAAALPNFLGAPSGSTVSVGGQSFTAIGGALFPNASSSFARGGGSAFDLTSVYASSGASGLSSVYQTGALADAAAKAASGIGVAGKGGAASSGASASTLAIAQALPLLGLSAGATLGGQFFQNSRAANAIGTVAGGALGLSAGLAAYAALGGTFASGAIGSTAAAIAGALPFIAPIAAVALIGAYLLNRNAKRRQEEQVRDKLTRDSNAQLDAIIAAMKSGKLSGADAIAQAMTIRANYMTQAAALTDRKTRDNALATVRELDYRIAIIRRLAPIVDNAQDIDTRLVPTFASGGRFNVADFSGYGRVSVGGFDGRDKYLVAIADDETIVNPQGRAALGGDARFRQAGIRGYESSGRTPPSYRPSSSGSSGGGVPSKIVVVQVTDDEYADNLVAQLSARGEEVLAVKVGNSVERNGKNGLTGKIVAQFEP